MLTSWESGEWQRNNVQYFCNSSQKFYYYRILTATVKLNTLGKKYVNPSDWLPNIKQDKTSVTYKPHWMAPS